MKNNKKTINVQSFDFDGCIFNGSAESPIEANQAFIEKVSQQINQKGFTKVIFMVGSNRQSFKNDYWNNVIRNTGSCFPALQKIFNTFQRYVTTSCEIDKYLLADSYGNKLAGENFNDAIWHFRIRNKKYEKYIFSDAFMDESKLNLLYAQIHRVATQNPAANIIYDFYDDKLIKWHGGANILKLLKGFFEKNTDLIPHNLRVRLHHYKGGGIKKIADIQGTGQIDYNYEYNIKKMAVDAGVCDSTILKKPYKNSWGFFQTFFSHTPIVTYLAGAKLQYFKNSRRLVVPSIDHINNGSLLKYAIHDMHAYGEYLLPIDQEKGRVACQLADKLLALLAKQKFDTVETLLKFKHEFFTLLDSENKTMATRRVAWGTILKNCIIAVTVIGIIPLIGKVGKAAYCYSSIRNITFFTKDKTTRQEKIETIREALSGFSPN